VGTACPKPYNAGRGPKGLGKKCDGQRGDYRGEIHCGDLPSTSSGRGVARRGEGRGGFVQGNLGSQTNHCIGAGTAGIEKEKEGGGRKETKLSSVKNRDA